MTKMTAGPVRKRWMVCWLAATILVVAGCHDRNTEKASAPKSNAPPEREVQTEQKGGANKIAVSDTRKATAAKAKDMLMERLSGRLMEVLQSEGPAAAIDVCSQEAVKIAQTVGEEQGVAIGRTSFKFRNPANVPRDWVKPFVEKRIDTPQHVQLDNGSLGALFPIRLDVKCLMCHGQPDEILDAVKPELAKRYPNDAAIGFKQGDLRGWLWVEVPMASEPASAGT